MAEAKSDISNSTMSIDSNMDDHRGRYCAICYHRFSCKGKAVPRILVCGHSFCTACLEKLIGKVARGYVRCPSCKTDTIVSGFSNDVERLAKNFAVLEILEGLDDGDKSSANTTNPILVCNIHEREPKKVYCLTDNEIICIYCQVYGDHEGHECQLISTAAEEGRQVLKQLAEEIMKEREKVTVSKKSIHDTIAAIRFKEEKSMREITHHFEMLRRKLYRRENQVKGKLKNLSTGKVKILEKQKKQLSDMIGRCDRLHASCQALIAGPDYDILQQKAQIQIDCRETTEAVSTLEGKPCTQNDLACLLESNMADKISNHGVIIEDAEKANTSEGCQSGTSSPQEPTSTEESEGQDPENIEWFRLDNGRPRRTIHSARSRRSIQPEDVMVLENDEPSMDGTRTEALAEVRPAAAGQSASATTANSSTSRTQQRGTRTRSTSLRGSHHRDALVTEEGVRTIGCHTFLHRCATRDRRSYPYMPLPFSAASRENNSSTTEESPDLSDLSDMEIELPLRSAWPNAGNWAGQGSRDAGTTVSLSAREILCVMQESEGAASNANNGNQLEGAAAQSTSEEPSPTRRRSHQHSQKSSSAYSRELKCSVFNCATKSSSFFVKCKKCSRVFCRDCVSESASARRCYKRPQGHSFVYLAGSSQQPIIDGSQNTEDGADATHNSPDVLRALLSSENSYRCSRCAGNSHSCHRNHACSKCNSRSRPQPKSSSEPRSDGSGESSGHTGSDRAQTSTRPQSSTQNRSQRKSMRSDESTAKQPVSNNVSSSSSNSSISSHTDSGQAIGGKKSTGDQTGGMSTSKSARHDRVWRARRSLSPCENLCPTCSVSNADDAVTCASCNALLLL
ncbi:uncharacterized protein LOC117111123 [Anneissia japonica]|uniref:uncharacterized protein LOC117111123 n=1 Tax=Anneissia japonica TaxID=1529436 RepID=UPI001425A28C|nr:uncharacterized protein LOC117111123 [Anneissia japonica]